VRRIGGIVPLKGYANKNTGTIRENDRVALSCPAARTVDRQARGIEPARPSRLLRFDDDLCCPRCINLFLRVRVPKEGYVGKHDKN
jgi:uncharacterized protein (DUF1499 family)